MPIAERSWWREEIEEPDPLRSIQLYARTMCRISGGAGLALRALETAASIDVDAAEVWARFQHQRRIGLNEFAVTLAQKTGALRYDENARTDTMWTLAPDAHLRLVHDAGWPIEQLQAWLADLLQHMFLESAIAAPTSRVMRRDRSAGESDRSRRRGPMTPAGLAPW